jgi:hypothetical protein
MPYNLRSTSKNMSDNTTVSFNMNKKRISQHIRNYSSLLNKDYLHNCHNKIYNLRQRELMNMSHYSEEDFEYSDDLKDENWEPSMEEEDYEEDDEEEELHDGDMEVIMSGKKSEGRGIHVVLHHRLN